MTSSPVRFRGAFDCYSAPLISQYVFINPVYSANLVQLATTDPTPHVSRFARDAQKRFMFEINGIANERYAVEASTNFLNWERLATNAMPATTIWTFVDEVSVTFPYRFYRTLFLP